MLINQIPRNYIYVHNADHSSVCPRCLKNFPWNHARRHYNRPSCNSEDFLKTEGYIKLNKTSGILELTNSVKLLLCLDDTHGVKYKHILQGLVTGDISIQIKSEPTSSKLHISNSHKSRSMSMLFTGSSYRSVPIPLYDLNITYNNKSIRQYNNPINNLTTYEEVVKFVKQRVVYINQLSRIKRLPSVKGSETKRITNFELSLGQKKYIDLANESKYEPNQKRKRASLLSNF